MPAWADMHGALHATSDHARLANAQATMRSALEVLARQFARYGATESDHLSTLKEHIEDMRTIVELQDKIDAIAHRIAKVAP